MAKDKVKKKKGLEDAVSVYDLYGDINATLDEVAHKMSDADTLDDMPPMSSGSLILDLILGGGIRPAMYTNFGPEQSAKTTTGLQFIASAIKENIPLISLRDFEGSSGNSIPYVTSIMKTFGVKLTKDQLFGKKDKKTGKWEVPPRVRYSASTMGVSFFNWFAAVLRRMPDKKMLENEWYLVYEDTKENIAKYGKYGVDGMAKKYGRGVYIKAPDDKLQGVVLVDSYPNMNPTSKDEDEADNSLALQARMFSKNLPRVKGYLASKKVALIGINLLAAVPMAMYGPSETEKGGNALKSNSDARLRFYPKGINKDVPLWPWVKKPGGPEIEKSVLSEGLDRYKYVSVKAIKNKLSEPYREALLRLWTKDADGVAHGLDPVFDTMLYLRNTGQLEGKNRKSLRLKWGGEKLGREMDWLDFKLWILGSKDDMAKMSKKAGAPKPMNLRAQCFKQVKAGKAEALYKARENALDKVKPKDADDED